MHFAFIKVLITTEPALTLFGSVNCKITLDNLETNKIFYAEKMVVESSREAECRWSAGSSALPTR